MKLSYQQIVASMPLANWSLFLLAVNLLTILAITFAKTALPPVLPLFYGNPYGAEQLAPSANLVMPSASALSICVSSIIIGKVLGDDFLKKVLFGGMATATVLALVTTLKIVFLVGNF
ncbi:hypothetical protein A2803_01135 [Candidatus Woesebacteria bacterium RIFCSPHIGHO2_01_FULL_44_21]|uniref:DUF1648 domain-containing protein n=1 Tax=Candidatus Woesebacteria bacterium RIFCSPHIGHO2_01_FULL_44_21 TaxID=1802503 RepID=A0A1F7YX59_9BACT|nr:MAG: hypothetical protein A2803_01135 [Candidatus Woesebacteria bacterium RIFCSPHIGHO2_01_FULL_44_21]OGM69737.1 MAG: hypothetical protein A2897_00325 [Candidatus Woesebacteria bacterium RIFCSPLOWO2_01_FULL_44_24b]